MNGIQIGDEFLDLSKDTTVELVLRNPIFGDDNVIPGSYSLPFNVPGGEASEKNSRLLKNPDVIENIEAAREVDNVRYWYDGIFLKKGNLQIDNSNELRKYSLNFIFGMSTLADNFKTAKLRDICNENVVITSASYTKRIDIICRTTIFGGHTFKLIVNGRTYSGTTNSAIATAINADTTEPRAKATYIATPHGVYGADSPNYFQLEPFTANNDINVPLTVSLENVYNPDDYDKIIVDASAFEAGYNDPIQDWLNDNFHLETPLDNRMYFPMIRNSNLYSDKNIKGRFGFVGNDFGIINTVNGTTGYVLNRPYDIDFGGNTRFMPFNRTSVAPMISLKWVMDTIAAYFDVEYEGDFLTDVDYLRGFFYHSNTLDFEVPFLGPFNWLATRRSFNINEFIPDWTAIDLFKNLQTRFNIGVYYNESTGKIRLQKREPTIKAYAYDEISHISSPHRPPKLNPVKGIRLEGDKDSDDLLAQDDFYETGESDQVIKTKITGMPAQENTKFSFSEGLDSEVGGILTLPVSQRPISTTIPSVIAFYAWKESVGGGNYDYPTADIHLTDGDFRFNGVSGMAELRWKNYLRFLLKRKLVQIKCEFDIPHINHIDWEKKVRYDRLNYLYDTIKIRLTNRRIEAAEVEMYTV